MDKSVFSTCLWTGVSLFACTDPGVSDRVVLDQNDRVVPAMPNNILLYQEAVYQALQFFANKGYRQYDNSLVVRYDVRNIPLKIDTKRFPNMKSTVDSYSFDNVRPVDLLDINIGSNRGLIAIIRGLFDERKMGLEDQCQRYTTLNVDENIFWRVLKVITACLALFFCMVFLCMFQLLLLLLFQVMYDTSNAGRRLRRYMGVSLAWWHSFKWATKRIVVTFACDFIAPMFHSLFPTKEINPMKLSHTSACTLLSYIRLAYPSFRQPLEAALANPVLLPRQKEILQNLLYLCEFFIPVVISLLVVVIVLSWVC